eukprot:6957424-Heterocapsa_arctica.AAC.1
MGRSMGWCQSSPALRWLVLGGQALCGARSYAELRSKASVAPVWGWAGWGGWKDSSGRPRACLARR